MVPADLGNLTVRPTGSGRETGVGREGHRYHTRHKIHLTLRPHPLHGTHKTAIMSGVLPSLVLALRAASALTNTRAHSRAPSLAAKCKGVQPKGWGVST
jgi:hypothetical protein